MITSSTLRPLAALASASVLVTAAAVLDPETANARATAAAVACNALNPPNTSPTDLNNDAIADLVVGVPNATVAGRTGAGAVDIHYRTTAGTTQRVTEASFARLGAPAGNDRFGRAVAFANAGPDDGCSDLVIGAPGSGGGRGSVLIAQGSNSGLTSAGARRIVGRTIHDGYGMSLAAYGSDVWVGAPYRTVGGHARAGAVDHYRVSGGAVTLVETLTENTPGVPGAAEANDRFGEVLDVDRYHRLVVGEPAENVGSAVDAGTVTVARLTKANRFASATVLSENTPGVPGTAETGDRFGASVSVADDFYSSETSAPAVLAVGVPGESLGAVARAGSVYRFDVGAGAPTHPKVITQETAGVYGSSAAGDGFGSSVTVIRGSVVAVGVPGKDLAGLRDAGDVVTTDGGYYRQGGSDLHTLGGPLQANARAGASVSRLGNDNQFDVAGGDQLVVALPGAYHGGVAGSGEVALINQFTQLFADSAGPVRGGAYGSPASAVGNGQVAH